MSFSGNVEVERLLRPIKLEVDEDIEDADASAFPIHVTLEHLPPPKEVANGDIRSGLYRSNLFVNGANGTNGTHGTNGTNGVNGLHGHTDLHEELETEIVHCKYLIGCDGAHSWVRK